jgi:ribose transport system substrate-binding protein
VKDRSLVMTIALALVVAVAVIAVLRDAAAPSRPERNVIVVLKTPGTTNSFWSSVMDGIESGAQDFGLRVAVRASRDETYVDEQIDLVRQAIKERPAAILLAAADYQRLIQPVREAKKQGLKVVCVDSFIASDDADSSVGTDNYEAGQKCGHALLRLLKQGSRVAVMSYVKGTATAIGRESGLLDVLEGRVDALETSYSSSDSVTAYSQAKSILARESARGNAAFGIAALNLPTLLGAARALDESGMKDRVVLVGVDNSAEIMKFIERGIVRDAIVQKPFNMGYLSLSAIHDLLEGKRPKAMINTGSVDIDRQNMFEPENEKLLFPVDGA